MACHLGVIVGAENDAFGSCEGLKGNSTEESHNNNGGGEKTWFKVN